MGGDASLFHGTPQPPGHNGGPPALERQPVPAAPRGARDHSAVGHPPGRWR
jgi:hypothetical protein